MPKQTDPAIIQQLGNRIFELSIYKLDESGCMTCTTQGGTIDAFDGLLQSLVWGLDHGEPGMIEVFTGLVSVVETIKEIRPDVAAVIRSGIIAHRKSKMK